MASEGGSPSRPERLRRRLRHVDPEHTASCARVRRRLCGYAHESQGHSSDTVLATVEMLVENDQAETIEFPFTVLSTDAGSGADPESVRPRVMNGSRTVELPCR